MLSNFFDLRGMGGVQPDSVPSAGSVELCNAKKTGKADFENQESRPVRFVPTIRRIKAADAQMIASR